MTSDGIKDSDWDIVKTYAAEICVLSADNLSDVFAKNKLTNYLKKLENQYGRLPSIVATQADYVDDISQSLALNKEAYMTACEISDTTNMSLISGGIAEIYLEELNDNSKGKFWLNVFKDCLSQHTDEYLNVLFDELSNLAE